MLPSTLAKRSSKYAPWFHSSTATPTRQQTSSERPQAIRPGEHPHTKTKPLGQRRFVKPGLTKAKAAPRIVPDNPHAVAAGSAP